MNSFVSVAGKSKELKEKMNKNLLPRFKNKLYATSNYIEQIFNNDMSDIITKSNIVDIKHDLEQRKNFIAEQKINFVSDFLKKMNNNLEKRHLKPIFSIRDKNIEFKNKSSNSSSMINIRRFKTPLNPIINNSIINNIENENINGRYELKNIKEKDEISNKSTETKNTLFPNESKIND